MSTPQPEAAAEYSRGDAASDGEQGPPRKGGAARLPEAARARISGVAGLGLGAGVLLAVAEFLPLYAVQPASGGPVLRTVTGGSHHGYALALVALVVAWLCWLLVRLRLRVALTGLALLGAVALAIALAADLPSAQAGGLIAPAAPTPSSSSGPLYQLGSAHPQAGMYLETLAAILLLAAGTGGLLLFGTVRPDRAGEVSSL